MAVSYSSETGEIFFYIDGKLDLHVQDSKIAPTKANALPLRIGSSNNGGNKKSAGK